MKYTTKEVQDLIEANGLVDTLTDNIDIDNIDDEDVKEVCLTIVENIEILNKLFEESEEFPDYEDED
jgi:hypothetical protein